MKRRTLTGTPQGKPYLKLERIPILTNQRDRLCIVDPETNTLCSDIQQEKKQIVISSELNCFGNKPVTVLGIALGVNILMFSATCV